MLFLETRQRPAAPSLIVAPSTMSEEAGGQDIGGIELENLSVAASSRLLPDWRGLADRALQPNPFMAPEFIQPAAMHLFGARDAVLTCAWRRHPRSRELVGLFVTAVPRSRGFGWGLGARGGLWTHDMMPLGAPLLSTDAAAAEAALSAFVAAQRRTGDAAGVSFPAVETDGPFAAVLARVAADAGLAVTALPDRAHTRGLDINLTRNPDVDGVVVAQDPASLRAMLEQALAMDATVPRAPGDAPAIIEDTGRLAFLRAAVRGFAQTGQVIMGRLNDGSRKASAVALLGPDRAYLWRLFGPSAHEPMAEAALTCAIRTAAGRPVAAAAAYPVAGFCTVPLRTHTAVLA